MAEALDLGEIERQVVSQDPVERLGLHARDGVVGLGQLLDIVGARDQRIIVALNQTNPEHVQDDLRVLGIVLVPPIVERFTGASERHG